MKSEVNFETKISTGYMLPCRTLSLNVLFTILLYYLLFTLANQDYVGRRAFPVRPYTHIEIFLKSY